MSCPDLLRQPDTLSVETDDSTFSLRAGRNGAWGARGVEVDCALKRDALAVTLATSSGARRVRLRWRQSAVPGARYLGDQWERGYGDLAWRGLEPDRLMPWYALIHDADGTHAIGVKTGGSSFAHWQIDDRGVTLSLDVRCGGMGVRLGRRRMIAAEVVVRAGGDAETPFAAAQAFCRMLCRKARMPDHPVYGGNNWYYAYGVSSHRDILDDSARIAAAATSRSNRPYMLIDDGWQVCSHPGYSGGPWTGGNHRFPDMPRLAMDMMKGGVRPGIWMRPLQTTATVEAHWRLPDRRFKQAQPFLYLDPSVPEVLELVRADIRRLVGWGYQLIKHDFTTFDLFGRWGFEMGGQFTNDGWHFADRGRSSAEITLDLYRAIRSAAGRETVLIGCNTVGHLAAGLVEIQRTGDDTSGREWERTRKMGVNTLAFRMAQHGAFFACDADCVGLTRQVPWSFNRQWLDLLARSGTPLFVSADPKALGREQRAALKSAFARAAVAQPLAEPLDWLDTSCPSRWRLGQGEHEFDWFGEAGVPETSR